MDEGELEFSNQMLDMNDSMGDDFLDDFLNNDTYACRHTHSCNPLGPDLSHTHTCVHVHTKILPTTEDKTSTEDTDESVEMKSKKRPHGNRAAVRKYREKKKARAASLEDEVARLRSVHQQLIRKLQGQAALEREVARLRCLLVDIRGRIEGEIGSFPYQKLTQGIGGVPQHHSSNMVGADSVNQCDVPCDDQNYCLHPQLGNMGVDEAGGLHNEGFGPCDVGYIPCPENTSLGHKDLLGCGQTNGVSTADVNPSAAAKKRKGRVRAPTTT
ncbi:hypothetical protein MKW94_022310 [Papaver nudicaule]|uniref:BZIP domain-containing protein n=1 Tax=Papaver nudicaule TaxID=74823 RepID=A0AA41VTX2_PAPNU|nr:hypothetical protein [Papaver nudicaule]